MLPFPLPAFRQECQLPLARYGCAELLKANFVWLIAGEAGMYDASDGHGEAGIAPADDRGIRRFIIVSGRADDPFCSVLPYSTNATRPLVNTSCRLLQVNRRLLGIGTKMRRFNKEASCWRKHGH